MDMVWTCCQCEEQWPESLMDMDEKMCLDCLASDYEDLSSQHSTNYLKSEDKSPGDSEGGLGSSGKSEENNPGQDTERTSEDSLGNISGRSSGGSYGH